MLNTLVHPVSVRESPCDCVGNDGFFRHRGFIGTYRCPCCNHMIIRRQCQHWPITIVTCPQCYETLDCSLSENLTRCALR